MVPCVCFHKSEISLFLSFLVFFYRLIFEFLFPWIHVLITLYIGASPVAEWLSSHTLLQWPRVSRVQILGAEMALSASHAVVVSYIAEPEGPTTGTYSYVLGGFGEKKKKKKKEYSLSNKKYHKQNVNAKDSIKKC